MVYSRKTALAASLTVAAGALVLGPVNGLAAEPAPQPDPAAQAATGMENSKAPGAVNAFWTPEREAAATPAPLPVAPDTAATDRPEPQNVLPPQSEEGVAASTAFKNPASPNTGLASVTRAERWGNPGEEPATTTGKIYAITPDGQESECTGSVIVGDNKNTVWTAGHCVHDGESGEDGYFTDIKFVPDHDNGQRPHGEWEYSYVNTTEGWQNGGDFAYDIAAIEFRPQPENGDLQSAVGAQGYKFGEGQEFSDVHMLGYPADGYERDDFTGRQLWYCLNDTVDPGWFDDRLDTGCDMGHGASGGPWLDELSGESGLGKIVSSTSHRNAEYDENGDFVRWTDNHMYGSNHGDGAINVYNDVSQH